MPLESGVRLGHFEILEPIGSGGMGEVYRARDATLKREVAIKVLPARLSTDSDSLARFQREARAIAALSHPNILAIYDLAEHDGVSYAVMELLEGETLRTRLGDGPLPASKAAALTLQIAEGLTAAHEKGIVHRDLKPENFFITFDGRVKILDFGLAKQGFEASVDEDGSSSSHVETEARTSPGTILGTAGYMSPEQIRGRECDPRSDLFSLGVTLVEMVSGTRPFSGDTVADTMSAILKDDPKALGNLAPSLERIARRCLEKKPQERFQTARELRAALDAVSDVRDTPPMAATVDRAPSVAVLPFADMSPAKDQEYFCEGIAEELINGLSSVAGLRVAARGSAFQFKSGAQDIRRIGEALNVETVLDGSVRTAGKRLRVTAQLNNAAEGYQLWSKRYDRNLDDVFAVQDEIAADIVRALDT